MRVGDLALIDRSIGPDFRVADQLSTMLRDYIGERFPLAIQWIRGCFRPHRYIGNRKSEGIPSNIRAQIAKRTWATLRIITSRSFF
jgi:hypothetical protein